MADRYPDFDLLVEQFQGTLDALLELLDTVSPHVADLDAQGFSVQLRLSGPEAESRFAEALKASIKEAEEATPEPPEATREQNGGGTNGAAQRAPTPSDIRDPDEPQEPREGDADKLVQNLLVAFKDDPETLRAISGMFRTITARPHRGALLQASLLAMAIGSLETAIGGIATQHFVLHPNALPSDDKEFSLADLNEFEDMADARDLAISRRVDGLMRGGLDDWSKWFEARIGVDFESLASDWQGLVENFQRRHIVVHNAGRVSRQYQSKVPSDDGPQLGAELPISREYLETALDEIRIFGTRLLLIAWAKWVPDEAGEASTRANAIVFEQLEAKRLRTAHCLAATGKRLATDELTRCYLQVNEWQAAKRREGLDSVADEIRAWDTSALHPSLTIAKAALLEDREEVFELLPKALEHEDLPGDALDWPLFQEVRDDPRWAEIEESAKNRAEPSDEAETAEALPPIEHPAAGLSGQSGAPEPSSQAAAEDSTGSD